MRNDMFLGLFLSLVCLSTLTFPIPVRIIVDADYESDQDNPWLSVPRKFARETKPTPKRTRGPKKTYEEKLQNDRERKRRFYQNNTEHQKKMHQASYLRRKADPLRVKHDLATRKIYREANREKISSYQREYYLRRKAEAEAKKRQAADSVEMSIQLESQKKRKLDTIVAEGSESHRSANTHAKKQRASSPKGNTEAKPSP
ncbi:uncharacterized protein FA14DRAFT_177838 [Meira miltonrushii]|uniref:BZIP domain-containing protein n=1 Tax=Meira miltonrushii TaxID=1280837 RepID=A0A316VST5_9BASI|nr:uncharacterized protein FA14DRAFT_177838 [Meira miltonrushii]PWN38575.1 hypothetical protein FA14DRAFT_177838 [Meira miltonrushii]